jgi:hypothetical protein
MQLSDTFSIKKIHEIFSKEHLSKDIFGLDTLCYIPFKYIYIYLFFATLTCILVVYDYYYVYLIFICCMVIVLFNHFYTDYENNLEEYDKSRYVHEVIDNQWIWMLILLCHIKFCFITIKDEILQLKYVV